MLEDNAVILYKQCSYQYPIKSDLFRPSELYPEYYWGASELSENKNEVYNSVREAFRMMQLDPINWNTKNWNPLGDIIEPGKNILIKPNLVMDKNHILENGTDCLYTHPSVVAAVIDYVIIALKGKGKIIIGDAPVQECNWEKLISDSGYLELVSWYQDKGIEVELVDFREVRTDVKKGIRFQTTCNSMKGKIINLGLDSEFANISKNICSRLRITNYDPNILLKHHNDSQHEYYISNYVLESDVIINMPKPKCHRKAGVTCAMKNLVGINVRKEFLPHHTVGSVSEGGDEYDKKNILAGIRSRVWDRLNYNSARGNYTMAYVYKWSSRFLSLLLRLSKNKYSEGSWYGNNTISRTVVDLNKIVYFADKNGDLQDKKQRDVFIVADMVIAGEKDGPIAPTPKDVGIIAMGRDTLIFDEVVSTVMGFDISKIPTIDCAKNMVGKYKFSSEYKDVYIRSNIKTLNNKKISEISFKDSFQFEANPGWKNHIELP